MKTKQLKTAQDQIKDQINKHIMGVQKQHNDLAVMRLRAFLRMVEDDHGVEIEMFDSEKTKRELDAMGWHVKMLKYPTQYIGQTIISSYKLQMIDTEKDKVISETPKMKTIFGYKFNEKK